MAKATAYPTTALDYSVVNPLECDCDWFAPYSDRPFPDSFGSLSTDWSGSQQLSCDSPSSSPSTVASDDLISLDSALLVQQLIAASSSADLAAAASVDPYYQQAANSPTRNNALETPIDGIPDDLAFSLPALLDLARAQSPPSDIGFDAFSPLSGVEQQTTGGSSVSPSLTTTTLADGGRVAYVPVYIPPPASSRSDAHSIPAHYSAASESRRQCGRSANVSGEIEAKSPKKSGAPGSVPSLKDVVAEVYNEQPGCVITLRKIQKLGYKASHIIKQHFAKKYGVRVVRLRLVHSRSKGCVERPGQPGPLRPANMGFLVLDKPASVEKILNGVSSKGGIEVINGVDITVLRFVRNPSHKDVSEAPSPAAAAAASTNLYTSYRSDGGSAMAGMWPQSKPASAAASAGSWLSRSQGIVM
ncbi:hypothetical protein FOL47_008563 [Perkinsus chesapeaki]|uniref:Uncharacterized protein n=1 Tax=Perkinsus chesapeaki TaxID=330153 RepID=A0A7J6LD41_PERCH|nr:hypothetical protein FOL47_008563 [Perkinsus chesapeaki]